MNNGIDGKKLGTEVAVTGSGGIIQKPRGVTSVGRTILPNGPRDVNDLTGIVRSSIMDILGDSGPSSIPIAPDVIDVEVRIISDVPPKIGN